MDGEGWEQSWWDGKISTGLEKKAPGMNIEVQVNLSINKCNLEILQTCEDWIKFKYHGNIS